MPWLQILNGELKGQRFPLRKSCLIGRGPHNHIVLDDSRVSRQHARISLHNDHYVLHDLGSVNGSYVNEERVERQVLELNDVVRFGQLSFRLVSGTAEIRLPELTPFHEVP